MRARPLGLTVLCALPFLLLGCQQEEGVTLESLDRMVRQGRPDAALEAVREALDLDPTRRDLQLAYGRLLIGRRDYHLALWPLREAARDPDYNVRALQLLAQTQLLIGNHEEALAALQELLAIEPENLEALRLRADANLASMRLEETLDDVDRLLEEAPDRSDIKLIRLRALLLLERADEAEEALEELEAELAERTEEEDPDIRGRVCAARAVFLLEKRDPSGWYETAQACSDRFPTHHTVLQQALEAHAARGEWDESIARIEKALAEDPDDGQIRYLLADYHRRLGDPNAGDALLREGIDRFDPPRVQDWRSLYEYNWQLGRFAEAIAALEKSIELTPKPSTTQLLQLADALVEANRLDEASAVADRLAEGYRDLILGRIRIARGDLKGAREALLVGLRIWPNNPVGRLLLGHVAARSGDLEEALNQYIEAYRIDHAHNTQIPEPTDAAKEIARLQLALGAYEQAAEFAVNHVASRPEDFEAYEIQARAGARAGKPAFVESALEALSRLPGGMAQAVALQAELVSEASGPVAAVETLRKWKPNLRLPTNVRVLDVFLDQLALQGQHEEAAGAIAIAIEAEPENAEFRALRARSLLRAGRPDEETRQSIDEALRLDPSQPLALFVLGEHHTQQGRIEEAVVAYERAAAIDGPLAAPAALAAARLLAGEPDRQSEARERLEQILSDHPLESRAATDLAELELRTRPEPDLDQALAWALRAAQFAGALPRSDASRAFELVGRVRAARMEPDLAREALAAALELDPGNDSAQRFSDETRPALSAESNDPEGA